MLPEPYRWIAAQFEPEEGNPRLLFEIARSLENDGDLPSAAMVYDRAFGIAPHFADIRQRRGEVLNQLAVVEHGIHFRYVPGGPFLMGSNHGEADEGPWHPVWLSPYWMAETPISWAAYCRLMDWTAPPDGVPQNPQREQGWENGQFHLGLQAKIRWHYCESGTGDPEEARGDAPLDYDTKPMVAASWQEAMELADHLSTPSIRYSLPTEAQWEKAARGGLIGARHAWGDTPPSRECCDFNRLWECSIFPMTTFAPNDYGLYAVNGGVWEWTGDWYDRDYYRHSPDSDPQGPSQGEEKVLRGGSWADCADAVTVTFRMSRGSRSWRDGEWGEHLTPTIGFRLCRMTKDTATAPRPKVE
ncbi:MAG TPA: SUMF1/EgtB/PvdO family nonheme iron enzyme [Gemmataceae bacterium]|nr:SUMF1/EgtB/PvdO family nonheme iron enzyme [Gemmataceae bacterium]